MARLDLCLFASTPEIEEVDFVVRLLAGSPDEICQRAVSWGYDGIEFFPNPLRIPRARDMERALHASGARLPVVDSGLMLPYGFTLLSGDPDVRRRSIDVFERMLDLAGELGAAVNIGGSRGNAIPGLEAREMDALTTGVFEQLAARAERVGAKILLEPTGDYTSYITTMDEVRAWVERIGSAAFGLMLDTYQLHEAEPSIEYGIRAAAGRATHVHLYDPSRWPPGVLSEVDRLDWPRIVRVLREEGFSGSGSVVLVPEGPPEEPARTSAAYLRALFDED